MGGASLIPNFNPRPPCGGRLEVQPKLSDIFDISTHALLAEGDFAAAGGFAGYFISTHALLAEGDSGELRASPCKKISTHALLAEGDGKLEQ